MINQNNKSTRVKSVNQDQSIKMDLDVNLQLKCRICLTLDTSANFIQLKGSIAESFTEVTGVVVKKIKLVIDLC